MISRAGPEGGAGYQVGSSVTVRALHQMPMEGPEGKLHAHDYRLDVVVGRQELDHHGMVCDLDVLRSALQEMADRIENRDLEEIRPAWAEAVTVEVLARWAHGRLTPTIRSTGGEMLTVRVWESPVDFAAYAGPVASGGVP
jgi:6-pyruvoyltetrahydropterin/6-carboxytetrahydropterin synthase